MKKGFTLIEIITVVALNPIELLRQGRDANRASDMNTLNKATSLNATK
jgi:hypothetical protein